MSERPMPELREAVKGRLEGLALMAQTVTGDDAVADAAWLVGTCDDVCEYVERMGEGGDTAGRIVALFELLAQEDGTPLNEVMDAFLSSYITGEDAA